MLMPVEEASSSFCCSAANSLPMRECTSRQTPAKASSDHHRREDVEGLARFSSVVKSGTMRQRPEDAIDPGSGRLTMPLAPLVIGSASAASRATSVETSVTMAK